MEKEIWKDVRGYNGKYKVSNMGRVKSYKKRKSSILKPILNEKNYYYIELYSNGCRKKYLLHRLVLETFKGLGIYPNNCCNHIDCDKTNNKLSNLEWCTNTENTKHYYQFKKTGIVKAINNECNNI